jgi:hypothetical protein
MKLCVGLPLTNNGDRMPQDSQHIFDMYLNSFNEPEKCMVPNLPGYSNCFSSMKDVIATSNLNAVTETFCLCVESYIGFLIREMVPHEVNMTLLIILIILILNLGITWCYYDERHLLLSVYQACRH